MSVFCLFGFFFAIGATSVALAYYFCRRFRAGPPLEAGGAPRLFKRPQNITGHGKGNVTSSANPPVRVQYFGVPFMKIDINKSVDENLNYNDLLLEKVKEHPVVKTESPITDQYSGILAIEEHFPLEAEITEWPKRGLLYGVLSMYDPNESEEDNLSDNDDQLDEIEEHYPFEAGDTEWPKRGLLYGVLGMYDPDESEEDNLSDNEVALNYIEEPSPLEAEKTGISQPSEEKNEVIAGDNMEKKPKKKKLRKRFFKFLKRCMCIKED